MVFSAIREPVIRRAVIPLADWPQGAPGLRLVFLADIHVAGPDMPPERFDEIIGQVNRLSPDIVLIGGDFVSDRRTSTSRYPAELAIRPLAKLRPSLGTVAVLGNHDHWRNSAAITEALAAAGVRVLLNDALTIGPLRIGGVDDAFTGRADIPRTEAAMRLGGGARIMLSHSPDVAPNVSEEVGLLLAGHTHCGQIRLLGIGAVSTMSDYGERFACGRTSKGRLRIITTGGLGTSILPLRLGTRPELWLVEVGPLSSPQRLSASP